MTNDNFAVHYPRSFAVFEQGRERGLHWGMQVYASVNCEPRVQMALGESEPGVPMTPKHSVSWLSASKPLTAVALALLVEQGRLGFDDPVQTWIPEFVHAEVTIWHLLTHTSGLEVIDSGWPEMMWDESLATVCAARLTAPPGTVAAYQPSATWFLLGEILRRVTGRSYAEIMTETICQPCGMSDARVSFSAEELPAWKPRLAPLWERQKLELARLDWHHPPRLTHPSPGSSWRGPIRDLARFYEALIAPAPLLSTHILSELTSRQRTGMYDQTLMHIVDFGLGFLLDSNQYGADTVPYGYGRYASPRTFGHGGAQCAQGYCDPDRGLVVAYAFNGRPGEPQHQRRARAFNEALSEDLGLY